MVATQGKFSWNRRYYTNIFGSDPHIEVTLLQLDEAGKTWVEIESHDYAVGLTGLGKYLAERKVRQYINHYGATHY